MHNWSRLLGISLLWLKRPKRGNVSSLTIAGGVTGVVCLGFPCYGLRGPREVMYLH